MRTIQFETIVNGGIIQIPEQYVKLFSTAFVNVTLAPAEQKKPKFKSKTKTMPSGIDEFPPILDTKGWKFSREEANER